MHGFALNVECDLSGFDRIVPCGIDHSHLGVTSMRQLLLDRGSPLANEIKLSIVKEQILHNFAKIFNVDVNKVRFTSGCPVTPGAQVDQDSKLCGS